MDFVDDQQIEAPRVRVRIGRKRGAQHFERPAVFEPVEADDCTREVAERVGSDTAAATQFANLVGVDHLEREAELFKHLAAPFVAQRRRAQDEHAARAMSQEHFLDDESRFDRFAETDVVGDQQVDARHVERANDRVELVVFERDAGAKRGLERLAVGRRDRAPANGVEKRVQAIRVVEAVALRRRKRRPF